MKRLFAVACVLFMIGTVPMGLFAGAGTDGSGPQGEDGTFTQKAGEDGPEGFTFDTWAVTDEDIEVLKDQCGLFDPTSDRVALVDGYGTGMVPPTEEEYATLKATATFYNGVTSSPSDQMPRALDHSTEGYFPPVRSQGGMGSCGSWATVYYAATYAQAKDEGWTDCYLGTNSSRLMSPNWAYNKVNYGYDGGSHTWTNAMLLATLGCSDWNNMPYTDTDPTDWGGEAAWRAAPRYRLQEHYDYTYGYNTMVLKSWLVQGFVLPMAFNANFYSSALGSGDNVISSSEYSGTSYNHANTIVGYDDNFTADGDAGAFKIVNSWGSSWGSAWGGNGYYWMTYDAMAELVYPVIRIYDRVDWEPTLLATIDQSTSGSRESRVVVGTDSGLYDDREPAWDGGKVNFPAFMALDVTELEEDLGLTDFWLYIGSGDNASTVSAFELEWYENGYSPASPTRTFTSPDTPKTSPGYMDVSFEDVHINVTAPLGGALVNKAVTIEGNCTDRIGRVILREDFEGPWNRSWVNVDTNSDSGYDTWGNATYRVNNGNRSVWCAGSDHGVAFFEDFNNGGSTPSGWTTYSAGNDTYPWSMVNSGYYGCGGSDYVAVADSDQGAGTNITEWLYMSTPFNASAFTGLELRFYVEYDYYDGAEYGNVLYATGSTYPTFTSIVNYTSDTYGYKKFDISGLDGEEEVYLAFLYHGTDDWCMVVDDVLVVGDKTDHDHNMSANLYTQATCSGFDNVTLEYYYWLESENNMDGLWSMYWSSTASKWFSLKWHTGSIKTWTKVSVEVPANATYIGFLFYSDGSTSNEGAYLDDVTLTGYIDLDAVDLSVDGGGWTEIDTSAKWSHDWASGLVADGNHTLRVRADYNGDYSFDSVTVRTDNTLPSIAGTWNDTPTTGESAGMYVNVSDVSGIGSVHLSYSFDGQAEVNVSVSSHTGTIWDHDLAIPSDAVNLSYRFWVEDVLGNGNWSSRTTVDVTDNDAPSLGTDMTSSTATTGDPLTFSISASDNVAVDNIYVRYWYQGDVTDTNVSSTGDTFEHTITVLHTLNSIHYELGVFDTSGSMDMTTGTVTVTDNDEPALGTDGTPSSATTGETVTLSIVATDNIGMSEVKLDYRFGTGTTQTVTMTKVDTDRWSHVVNIPSDSLDRLYYQFSAGDAAGNVNTSTEASVEVLDNDLPTFGTDSTLATATTGDPFTFSVEVSDNIGVQGAWVVYRYGSGSPRNGTLSSSNGLLWQLVVTIDDTLQGLTYSFGTEDTSGNVNTDPGGSVSISDNDGPTFGTDATPVTGTTGDPFTFSIRIQDNIALGGAWLTYRYGTGAPVNVTLTSSDNIVWTYIVTIDDTLVDLTYTFGSTDSSGNVNSTTGRTVDIVDNDRPTFGMDATPATATTGDPLTFSTGVDDNIQVQGVWVVYRYGSGAAVNSTLTSSDGLVWTGTVTIDHTLDDMTYSFGTTDTSGNVGSTTGRTVVITDNDRPTFGTDATPATATTGDPLTFSTEVGDNIQVQGAWVIYRYGSGTEVNATLTSSDGLVWTYILTIDDTLVDLTYTFGTTDTSGNVASTTGRTVDITDNDGPTFGTDATPATATTGDPLTFSTAVDDNIQVQAAWVVYRYGSGMSVNTTLTSSNGLVWTVTVTIDHTLDDMTYSFGSTDTSGNVGSTTGRTVDITDNDGPSFGADATPATATTGDPHTFSTEVSDNIQVQGAWVVYRYGSGTPVNVTLTSSDDLVWECTVTIDHTLEDLTYTFGTTDTLGNAQSTTGRTVVITDNDRPSFGADTTPTTATTGDPFTFSIEVGDNIEVQSVWVVYRYGTGTPENGTMGSSTGLVWELDVTIGVTLEDLSFSFGSIDTSGNTNSTSGRAVSTIDNDRPSFGEDASPDTADTDHLYAFSIPVWDNIGLAEVWVEYRYGEGETMRLNLTSTTATSWEGSMIVEGTLDDLIYIFGCVDTSGNTNSTQERTVDVIDVNGPGITNEGTKSWTTTGDPFEFTLTAWDNVGLKSCILWYAFDEGELAPVEMEVVEAHPSSGNVLYSLVIDVPSDLAGNITYRYEIEDLYGNVFLTHVDIVRVRDDDEPWVVEDRTPGEVDMGEDLTFEVVVSDNVGIGFVEVEYAMGDGDPVTVQMVTEGTEGVHSLTIEVAVDELGPISYRFRVVDLAWNEVNGSQHQVTVTDGIPPEVLDASWGLALKGTDVTIVLLAKDNVGVEEASLGYRFGDGTQSTVEMDENMEAVIPIPRNAIGDLRLVFTVLDAAGNEAVSEEFLVPLLNARPTVDPVPVWELTEEEEATLDLAPYISDANDDPSSLILSCGDGTITLDGLVLRAIYVVALPDRTIDLNVSDGEDGTDFQVTIHIVEVNDAPVIMTVSPQDGEKYKEGKVVSMSVTVEDEDGDDLTVTWTEGGTVLGTGTTLDYSKLKPGERTIKVTLTDGVTTVEDEFTITITKEEESPGFGWAAVLVAMIAVLAASNLRRTHRK